MKRRSIPVVGGAVLAAAALGFAATAEPIRAVRAPEPIVFVCRNGVAMSVWSAAYFNRLASQRGIRERAIARAAISSFSAVPYRMAFALAIDGFRLGGYRPEVLSADDVRSAELVVAIDTELPPDVQPGAAVAEHWDGFPPMREQYFPSRAALKSRVQALVERLAEAAPGGVSAEAAAP